MTSHIKMGFYGLLRDYALLDPKNYQAILANPFAANINTQTEYGAFDQFNDWTAEDWTEGVGKRKVKDGGCLYAHMDTRFPNQMILPMGLSWPTYFPCPSNGANYAAGDLTVDGTIIEKVSASFTTPTGSRSIHTIWFYLDAPTGTTITTQLCSDDSGTRPKEVWATGTGVVVKNRPGPVWVKTQFAAYTLPDSHLYHITISGDASFTIPLVTSRSGQFANTYDGTVWTARTTGFQFVSSYQNITGNISLTCGTGTLLQEDGDDFLINATSGILSFFAATRGRLFGAQGNRLFEILPASDTITEILTTGAEDITDLVAVDDKIFIAHGSGYKYYDTTDDSTTTEAAKPSSLWLLGGYFLWRAHENDLYYTSDLAAWTQLDNPAGPDAFEIRGMAVLDTQVYLATDAGLYVVMPGDYIVQVTSWPMQDERNGVGMVEWQGSLYIPLAEDLTRFTVDGTMMQLGLRTGEELPADVQGSYYRLHATNYFLLASLSPQQDDGSGTLWAWNGSGWHNIATAPQGVSGGAIYMDTSTDPGYLYWGGSYGMIMRLNAPSNVINPVRDVGASLFARHGWLEFDRFYGDHVALDKDFESVYFDTEDMTSGTVAVYWQDQDSTDWELLNTSTEDSDELRWTLASGDRPNSTWLKLGLLLRTDDEIYTPIIRAHRLKFNALITDRWRWQLLVILDGPRQQLVDGTLNEYSTDQQKTHIESLLRGVEPFILQDVDDSQYEVRTMGGTRRIQQYEWEPNTGEAVIKYIYDFTVEATTGTEL